MVVLGVETVFVRQISSKIVVTAQQTAVFAQLVITFVEISGAKPTRLLATALKIAVCVVKMVIVQETSRSRIVSMIVPEKSTEPCTTRTLVQLSQMLQLNAHPPQSANPRLTQPPCSLTQKALSLYQNKCPAIGLVQLLPKAM